MIPLQIENKRFSVVQGVHLSRVPARPYKQAVLGVDGSSSVTFFRPYQSVWLPVGVSCTLGLPDALLHVGLEGTKCSFVTLDRELQNVQQPFCSVEVGHNPLCYHDRLRGHSGSLRIEPEIDEQLLGRARYAAEIGVAGQRFGIIHFDLRRLRLLFCWRLRSGLAHTRRRYSAACF